MGIAGIARKLRTWSTQPAFVMLWAAPVWVILGLARLAILLISFKRIAAFAGRPQGVEAWVPLASPAQCRRAQLIGRTIKAVAKNTPWESNCFPQALTARLLLGLYGVPHAIYFRAGARHRRGGARRPRLGGLRPRPGDRRAQFPDLYRRRHVRARRHGAAAMTALRSYIWLVRLAPRWRLAAVFALMVLVGVTDGVNIMLLVPMLALLDGQASDKPVVQALLAVLDRLGLPVSIGGLLVLFVVLIALRNLIQVARERMSTLLQHEVIDQLRERCLSSLFQAEWRWVMTRRSTDQANLVLAEVNRAGIGLNFLINLTAGIVTICVYIGSATLLSPPATLLLIATGGVIFLAMGRLRNRALTLGTDLGTSQRALHQTLKESLDSLKLTKILGSERRHLRQLLATIATLRDVQISFALNSSLTRAAFQVVAAALMAAYLWFGVARMQIPIPELLTLVFVYSRLAPAFMVAQQNLHQCLNALPALYEARSFLKDSALAREPAAETAQTGHWPIRDALTLERVSLRYEGRDRPALDGISLSFPANSTTAVMGPSGVGKSSLADVVMGVLLADAGALRVDGTAVTPQTRKAWMGSVAYVPQETYLFHDTIRNNLLWGRQDATEAELAAALKSAAAEFVFDREDGLDTVVGDGGVRLSGGERQRIALARALLRAPSLLILDEATSSLDRQNEARIYDALRQLHGRLTIIVISHSGETVNHADRLIVLRDGRVDYEGPAADAAGQARAAL